MMIQNPTAPLDYATPAFVRGSPTSALLMVEDVSVRFKKFVAVDDVTFTLHAGDLLGLIGPNGAGKTTLLRTIAGLQPTDKGVVRILGERLDRWTGESMRHVGFTPDTPPLYDQLTVRQFLQFIARGYDLSGSEVNERIDFWLEKVWLSEKADQKISALSRGMRQRVGIARTLLPNPHVILLDEPAAGLDPAGRVQFREVLNELRRQGKVIIVSSHILADMGEYCSHIGIVSHGKLLKFGTVREISQAGGDATRSTYRVALAKPVVDLKRRLESIEGITDLVEQDHKFTLIYDAGADAAAKLLAELVGAGVPVCAFTEAAGNLEEAYLATGVRQVD
jgi:ABC-2 type transport system ATP-binding protein